MPRSGPVLAFLAALPGSGSRGAALRRGVPLLALLALLPGLACDPAVQEAPPEEGAAPGSTTFDGVFGGGEGKDTGRVVVEIEAEVDPAAPAGSGDVRALAAFYSSAGTKRLLGSYDRGSTALLLEGEGISVSMSGTPQGFGGSYTGDNGPGVLVLQPRTPETQVFCGTFTGALTSGIWNLLIDAEGVIAGVVGPEIGNPDLTYGLLEGTELTIVGSASSSSGTLEGGQIRGTWDTDGGIHGTFEGTTAACPTVP